METFLQNKKITLFTAETVPSFAGGGRHAFQLASFLANKGALSKIVCYNYNNQLCRKQNISGVAVRRLLYFNGNIATKLFSLLPLLWGLFVETIKAKVIIIYGNYLIGYPLIIFIAWLFRKKLVFQSTLLESDDMSSIRQKSGVFWPVMRFLFRRINCYWAINSSFQLGWNALVGNTVPCLCLTQGVYLENYKHPQRHLSKRNDANNILNIVSCGILIERKGYREVFNALSKLNFPYTYTVVGQYNIDEAHRSSAQEKTEMEELYKLGKKLLGDKIRFVGTTENIQEYYSNADILLHGAWQEGTPNVMLEAMACGLPIVCRKLDGVAGEVLKHNITCLEYTNEQELYKTLVLQKDNAKQRNEIAESAHAEVAANYSFEIVVGKIIECLSE